MNKCKFESTNWMILTEYIPSVDGVLNYWIILILLLKIFENVVLFVATLS